jgi:hypothetical protein
MDDITKRLAKELAEAISAAAATDPRVEACRTRARAAGYEMKVSIEAVVGFSHRFAGEGVRQPAVVRQSAAARPLDITASDKRFLRSLRIAADETKEEV